MRLVIQLSLFVLLIVVPTTLVASESSIRTTIDPGGCLLEHVAVERGTSHYQYDGFSSDGSRLVISWERPNDERGAFVLDIESGERTALPAFNAVASFAPDGRTLVGAVSIGDGKTEIIEGSTSSSDYTAIYAHEASDWLPSYSSSGDRVLFNSYRTGSSDIYVYDRGTKSLSRLTNSDRYEAHAQFSPDDSLVLFHRNDGNGDYNLYTISMENRKLSQLTSDKSEEAYASWSPDGTKIVFASDRFQEPGVTDLFLMNADGTDIKRLTEAPAKDAYPFFAPDGDYIYFSSYREPQGVYRMALDSGADCIRRD